LSLAQRFERRLEGLVGGAFARMFKGQVEPVEIGTALQREAADKRNVMGGGGGQVLSPNRYRVTLSPSDYERLAPWEAQLANSLAELLQDYLDENRWDTIGDIEVYLARDDELHTGVFGVASRMEPQAPPRRRPYDSLSLPVVPGMAPGQYPDQPDPNGYGDPNAYGDPNYGDPNGYGDQNAYAAQPYGGYGQPGAGPEGYAPPFQPAPPAPAPQAFQPPAYQPPAYPQGGYGEGPGQVAVPRPAGAMLIVDQTGRRYDLRHGSNVVGRGTESDLQLLDQGISRRHLDIQYDGHYATAYDLGSTNGTTVNGHEINSQVLRHGDVLRVGHTRIVFHQSHQGP
jgi:hypothetical protein